MYSYGSPPMAVQKPDDQHEHTFSSYVRIRDVVLKTCLGRWTIGRSGERVSGISELPARHDDDDDDIYIYIYTYTYIYIYCCACLSTICEDISISFCFPVHSFVCLSSLFEFGRIYLSVCLCQFQKQTMTF